MPIDRNAAADAIDAFLRAIGRDPTSEPDLVGTGARVAAAYVDELCAGYAVDTLALLRDAAIDATASGLVVVRDVPVVTMCPHHLLPASGTATIAMHANERIVGLGTLAAVADAHARRLTLQEKIGEAVASDIMEALTPDWCACRIVLAHGCMIARGERAVGSRVETVAVRGAGSPKKLASVYAVLGVGS
jgi:GTP cyclohydrolase I